MLKGFLYIYIFVFFILGCGSNSEKKVKPFDVTHDVTKQLVGKYLTSDGYAYNFKDDGTIEHSYVPAYRKASIEFLMSKQSIKVEYLDPKDSYNNIILKSEPFFENLSFTDEEKKVYKWIT